MKNYFQGFNYSLANEDNHVEIALAEKIKAKSILAIAGSGNRSLFLASVNPNFLSIVDSSSQQINYCRFKENLIQTMSSNDYWTKLEAGPLYNGKYEKLLKKFSYIIRFFVGTKKLYSFYSQKTIQKQVEFYHSQFPKKRWSIAISIISSPIVMNFFLYKGSFIKKNIDCTYHNYYLSRLEDSFSRFLIKDNFFIQLLFFGKIMNKSTYICENDPVIYQKTKEWLKSQKPNYLEKNILHIKAKDLPQKIDFFSYSNVPSYYQGELEVTHMQLIKELLLPGAIIMIRFYLRLPLDTNFEGYLDITEQYQDIILKDKVNMYTIKIYQYVC